jgi:RNA polymerase sigma-70 factor (ECF subfamily)
VAAIERTGMSGSISVAGAKHTQARPPEGRDLSSRVDPRLLLICFGGLLVLQFLVPPMIMGFNESWAQDIQKQRITPKAQGTGGMWAPAQPVVLEHPARGKSLNASSASIEDDGALVRKVRRGDSRAFEILVRRHLRDAHALALSVVRREDLADDVCQEAFLSALRSIEQCRDPERFRGWLMVIVRNRALTELSSEARRGETPIELSGQMAAGDDPLADLERKELKGAFTEAVQHLSGLRRKVFVLHDVEGLDHGEIARELGISRGASRVHLHFARRTVRDRLSRDWQEKA